MAMTVAVKRHGGLGLWQKKDVRNWEILRWEMSEQEGQIEDSESQDGCDSHNEKTQWSGAITEEGQKLREIEVRNVWRRRSDRRFWVSRCGCDSDSRSEKTSWSGAMTEERRQKLREIEVRNVGRGRSDRRFWVTGSDTCLFCHAEAQI